MFMTDYEHVIEVVDGLDGVCFNSNQSKYVCPLTATYGDSGYYRGILEWDARFYRFTQYFDKLMEDHFNLNDLRRGSVFNVEVYG